MNLTQKEILVLKAIAENDYQDDPIVNHRIWMLTDSDTKSYGIIGKELSGVCSSLSKKV